MIKCVFFGTESERIRVRTSTGQNVHGLVETYTGAGENVHGLKAQVQCNVLETYTGTGENVQCRTRSKSTSSM